MKIHKYKSEQFAGIRNVEVELKDGMNVILGNNETGKSTMIAAIFHGLMTSTKIDRRKDKEFMERYFPSTGIRNIDVTLEILAEETKSSIEKIWDQDGKEINTKCKNSDGDVIRGKQAEDYLADLRKHSLAVYENLVFGQQNNEDEILQWFYRFFEENSDNEIKTIRQKITEAFSVAGGISEEHFLSLINSEMETLGGRWDFIKDQPEKNRGIDVKWTKGAGTILTSYYEYKELEKEWEDAIKTERDLAICAKDLSKVHESLCCIKKEKEDYDSQKNSAFLKNSKEKLLNRILTDQETLLEDEKYWPKAKEAMTRGVELLGMKEENDRRKRKEQLSREMEQIKKTKREIRILEESILEKKDLDEDYKKAKTADWEMNEDKIRLSAQKLHTKIQLEPEYTAKVETANQKEMKIRNEKELDGDGFVSIIIPNVAQIMVAPKELNINLCQERMEKNKKLLQMIFSKYQVETIQELEIKWKEYNRDKNVQSRNEEEHKRLLMGKGYEEYLDELQNEYRNIQTKEEMEINPNPEQLIEEFLNQDLFVAECLEKRKASTLEAVVAVARSYVDTYEKRHESMEVLGKKIQIAEKEISDYKEELKKLSDIKSLSQEEYDDKNNDLIGQIKKLETEKEELNIKMGTLSQRENSDMGEMEMEVERLQKEWEQYKNQYQAYETIKNDFLELQKEGDDRFKDFHNKLNENLALITGGDIRMSVENGLTLISGKNPIPTKDLLSEGTKKTLLLAFRLSVLDYFYKDDHGFVVLDDAIIDMDPTRRESASGLLKEFAKENQVIFTTCDPEIAKLLGGNLIYFS